MECVYTLKFRVALRLIFQICTSFVFEFVIVKYGRLLVQSMHGYPNFAFKMPL